MHKRINTSSVICFYRGVGFFASLELISLSRGSWQMLFRRTFRIFPCIFWTVRIVYIVASFTGFRKNRNTKSVRNEGPPRLLPPHSNETVAIRGSLQLCQIMAIIPLRIAYRESRRNFTLNRRFAGPAHTDLRRTTP